MSFNFGANATSTPAKPSGFSSFAFGSQTTSAAPAFGASTATPTFGAATATPAFGAATATPAFGAPAATPAFGTATATPAFGAPATTPAFGTATATPVFGAPAATPAFGTATATSAFGAPAATPAFGAAAAPAFGTTTTTPAPTFGSTGGFGTNIFGSTTPGFNTGNTTTGPNLFKTSIGFPSNSTTSTAPIFSGFGTGNTSLATSNVGGFSAPATGFGTSFGTNFFGNPASGQSNAPGFGGFGSFGQQQQQQQQQPNPDELFAQSIFNVSIFGDERDTIISKWNYLQALWGSGKLFYSQTAPPVDVTPENQLCRFKTISYSRLPGKENKVGLVSLLFNKNLSDIKNQQQQIITNLHQALGNKQNLTINFESFKQLSDTKSQVIIYVEEKSQQNPNEVKRILATDVSSYFNQQTQKQQLNNMGIVQILPFVLPDEDQLKEFLENPPKGIDPRMWKQAKLDNPDPTNLIPIPLTGFNELKSRIKFQENEIETHVQVLSKLEKDLGELKQRNTASKSKIMEHRRKLAELSHRVLKIVVKQESTRKMGIALSPEEEILKTKLENMTAFVTSPTQFKGRLSELLSQMRMQRNQWSSGTQSENPIDKDSYEEVSSILSMQQQALGLLIETVNKDVKYLNIILEGMNQLVRG